ncbi:hypothetical protein EVAR_36674_1 [Eumeta japonica]|uniref:Uncharacterized protein n=1 Tax=Eumeta variegata TaxID=151549 RepID=A0A4C1ZC10_EUMVA|nr:hypothetical protein EVAR_36674_1 [Eumeta japonica]
MSIDTKGEEIYSMSMLEELWASTKWASHLQERQDYRLPVLSIMIPGEIDEISQAPLQTENLTSTFFELLISQDRVVRWRFQVAREGFGRSAFEHEARAYSDTARRRR